MKQASFGHVVHSQSPAARNCRYGHSSLHCYDFSLLPFWSFSIYGREWTDWPYLKRITLCALIFDTKSILKLLYSSKRLMLVIECRHSFNFYSWLIAREIFDLTMYVAHTLNKLRPLLTYKRYLQNLEEISSLSASLSCFVYPKTTLAPFVPSLQNTKGSLLFATFFQIFINHFPCFT